ncbi:VOC family protein [Novosphingobium sp. SG720]|uniref:VOC family protein n=1 Tax=Novosphingobium sp. SG720 TaxID=2586998 RepID=UPI0014466D49|nr:VOC family protein [Novosphingobium sp. SG720]NKJ44799.1 catechol-2,3-dioxygenase [Novosphingobium sp. SG720]
MEIGHIGLYVKDFDRMLAFYQGAFGFAVTDIARSDARSIVFLTADRTSHHQLVLVTGRPDGEQHLINQLSFRLKTLGELRRVYRYLVDNNVAKLEPLTHGIAWSVYFADPEGNRVEAYTDTPWYITQPYRTPIDLLDSEEDIYAETEALCRAAPGFKPMADWSDMTARTIRAL